MDPTRLAFQEFMLGGKQTGGPTTASSGRSRKGGTGQEQRLEKKKKQATPIIKAIQGKMAEWKEVDLQLGAVLDSISNLRFRIWCETRKLQEHSRPGRNEWEKYGLRGTSHGELLRVDDIQLALNHDLIQHERMLSGARALISSLAQVVNGIGRRLDEWMMLEYVEEEASDALELLQEVCVSLSGELYRKQQLVKQVLDTCNDGLTQDEVALSGGQNGNPRAVARRACRQWKNQDGELAVETFMEIGSV